MGWQDDLGKIPVIGGILSGPKSGDTTPDTKAGQNSAYLQRQFGSQAQRFRGAYDPNQVALNTAGQNQNIVQLTGAANGTVPSAAQIQLQQQGAQNAAGAYGLAAALQGRNPGQALMTAQNTALQTQAQTNAALAAQRANEMAAARGQLTGALSGMQGQQTTTRGQDLGYKQDLAGDILAAGGQQITAAGNTVSANAANAASQNGYNGALVGAGAAAAAPKPTSDRREKTDVEGIDTDGLMKLADQLKAFAFKYKNPGAPGEAPGQRVGVMAQDAERGGPVGKGMVDVDGSGTKRLDIGNSIGAALAMSAEALRRTRKAA